MKEILNLVGLAIGWTLKIIISIVLIAFASTDV